MSVKTNLMDEAKEIDMPSSSPIAKFSLSSNHTARYTFFDNLLITNTEGDYSTATADYTVKWVCDGEAIEGKNAVTRTGDVGSAISLDPSEKNPFTVGAKKYIYDEDDVEGKTVDSEGSTVVTITVHEAETWNYTINAVDGEGTKKATIFEGSALELDAVSYAWPRYVNVGGTLYEQAERTWNAESLGSSFTLDENNKVINLVYTETEISSIAFIVEGEDISGMTETSAGNVGGRASGCAAGYAGSNVYITTLPAGVYSMFVDLASPVRVHTYTFDGAGVSISSDEIGKANHITKTLEFTLVKETDITLLSGAGDGQDGLDYLYIQRTGNLPANVTTRIGSTGYSTFSSQYLLDLDNISGATPYYASATTETSVTLTEAKGKVLDGTGLILKGNVGATVTIPIVGSGATAIADNLLVGCPNGKTLSVNANYYVMVNNDGKAEFQSLEDNLATIPEGKAYLDITEPEVPEGSRLSIIFADDATSVSRVEKLSVENSVFNLNGQRVAAPQKGLYIVNGKKVIVK